MYLSKKILMYLSMKRRIHKIMKRFFKMPMRDKFQSDGFFTCYTSTQSKFLSTHSRFVSIIAVKKCNLAFTSF